MYKGGWLFILVLSNNVSSETSFIPKHFLWSDFAFITVVGLGTDGIILEKLGTKGTPLAENESADIVLVDDDPTLWGIDFFDSKAFTRFFFFWSILVSVKLNKIIFLKVKLRISRDLLNKFAN